MKKVILVIQDAGSGHRSTAKVIRDRLNAADQNIEVRIANIHREMIQPRKKAWLSLPLLGESLYNFLVKHDQIWAVRISYSLYRALGKLKNRKDRENLKTYFQTEKPDLVVSLMPWVNHHLFEVADEAGIKCGIIVTDFTPDVLPWVDAFVLEKAAFIFSPNPISSQYLTGQGYPADRIVQGSFPVIHPRFFKEPRKNPAEKDGAFTLMIAMGGSGSRRAFNVLRAVDSLALKMNIMVCCGYNTGLKNQAEAFALQSKHKITALPHIDHMEEVLSSADLLITKPGPATITEAVVKRVPMMIVDKNTLPQEEKCLQYLKSTELCFYVRGYQHLKDEMERILRDRSGIEAMKARMEANVSPSEVEKGTDRIIGAIMDALR